MCNFACCYVSLGGSVPFFKRSLKKERGINKIYNNMRECFFVDASRFSCNYVIGNDLV